MSEVVDGALRAVAKGTLLVLVGTFVGMLLAFFARVVLVRNVSVADYGIFSIALAVVGLVTVFSELGLQGGIIRNIAFFRGKQDAGMVLGVIFSAFQLGALASLFLFAVLFLLSGFLSLNVFHNAALSLVLKVLLVAAPLTVVVDFLSAVFRGLGRAEGVFFYDFLLNLVKIASFLVVAFLGLSFFGMVYAYLFSFVFVALLFVLYSFMKLPSLVDFGVRKVMQRRNLLLFSVPLLAQAVMGMIMEWSDTLMIGYFMSAESVGVYNMAMPVSKLVPLFLVALVFFYVPVASGFFAKNLLSEVRRLYAVLTKWVFSFSLPLFLVVFLFPDALLQILFNTASPEASLSLRILSLGFFVHVVMGPTASTLVVFGRTKTIMAFSVFAGLLNVLLNFVLIPRFGIVGAAAALSVSFVLMHAFYLLVLFSRFRIQPFTGKYLRPFVSSVLCVAVVYYFTKSLFAFPPLWLILLMFIVFLLVYALCVLLTRSFDDEDLMILLAAEKQLGLKLSFFKGLLRRFV